MLNRFILILVLLFTSNLVAQKRYPNILFFENGDSVRCKILIKDKTSLTVKTKAKEYIKYNIEHINKIEKFNINRTLKKGYFSTIEFGIDFKRHYYFNHIERLTFLNYIFSKQIDKNTSLGVGFGLKTLFRGEYKVPFYIDFKVYGENSRVIPFLELRTGYMTDVEIDDFYGEGFIFQPSVGINTKFTKRKTLNISTGLNFQFADYMDRFQGINFKLGLNI